MERGWPKVQELSHLGLDSMVLSCVAVCALFLLVVNKVTSSRTRELLVTILYFIPVG